MHSPFPGMDPYLEDPAFWMDFHERFITYCSDALNLRLSDDYETRIEEHITLVRHPEQEHETRRIRADVAISATHDLDSTAPGTASAGGGVATLEPVTVPLALYDDIHESYVTILHRPDQRLIAVIELLSPTNNSGDGYHQYVARRNSLLASRVHLIEFDLLVGGQRMPFERPLPRGDYFAMVSRGDRRPDCDVFAWTVRDPLPRIPIPLCPPDPDLLLDLAELFQTTYERGRYHRSLRYDKPPPALSDDHTLRWAGDIIGAAASRRSQS